ncbi:MAG: hypothetical protein ACKO37_08340 [Vampirovibrionales bacterium]
MSSDVTLPSKLYAHFGQSARQAQDPIYLESKQQAQQVAQDATSTQHTGPTIIINMGPTAGDTFQPQALKKTPPVSEALQTPPSSSNETPSWYQEPVKPAPQTPIPLRESPSQTVASRASASPTPAPENTDLLQQWEKQGLHTNTPEFLALLLKELQLPRAVLPVAPERLLNTPNAQGNVWESLAQASVPTHGSGLPDGITNPLEPNSPTDNTPMPANGMHSTQPTPPAAIMQASNPSAAMPPVGTPPANASAPGTTQALPQTTTQPNGTPGASTVANPSSPNTPQAPTSSPQTALPPSPAGGDETYKFAHAFNDPVIQSLNRRLNDPDPNIRSDAATEFYQIISSNQGIVTDHRAKPYIEAFAKKIARDSSSNVHVPLLLALESGLLKDISPSVVEDIRKIKDNNGMLGMEPTMVNDALRAYEFQTGSSTGGVKPTPPSTPKTSSEEKAHQAPTPSKDPHQAPTPSKKPTKKHFWQTLWPFGHKTKPVENPQSTSSTQAPTSADDATAPKPNPLPPAQLPPSQLKEEQNPSSLPPAYPRAYSEEPPTPTTMGNPSGMPQPQTMMSPNGNGLPDIPMPSPSMAMPTQASVAGVTNPTTTVPAMALPETPPSSQGNPLTGQDALNAQALQEALMAMQQQQQPTNGPVASPPPNAMAVAPSVKG